MGRNRRPPLEPLPCTACGTSIPYGGHGQPRKVCADVACKRAAGREYKRRHLERKARANEQP
ncbi:hypothetical protein IW248_004147 [Micromonospora ureilytica]|uniref:Recombination protein RecR n=1 Tax=Micromonospora ureilytica TaxID=709868 RepID=A0ABS0JM30_9ACTN|nr:hypothetical protein [Micromonospora ureilytica]